jgi:ferredoxin-NADP reductase
MIPIFTGYAESGKGTGRLDRSSLETMLSGSSRMSAIFVCGPPQMMKQVRTDLKTLGFPARWIFTEAFGF